MNFVSENMYLIIFIAIGILAFFFLLRYYIYSCINSETNILKKKIKKLHELIQSKTTQAQIQAPPQPARPDYVESFDDNDGMNERHEIDGDSYFDPTKVA